MSLRELVQRVADGELGRDLGDREAGRLRGERRGARHARVHLDDDHAPVVGIDRELHVRAAGVDADLAQHAIEASRMIWYSLSVSVCAGATVIESPVCTPIGSRFSIEQMMMQLSFLSRTTSISNSFQPSSDSSISSSCVGESVEAALAHLDELVLVVGDAAAGAAERERGPDDRREADRRLHLAAPPRA